MYGFELFELASRATLNCLRPGQKPAPVLMLAPLVIGNALLLGGLLAYTGAYGRTSA